MKTENYYYNKIGWPKTCVEQNSLTAFFINCLKFDYWQA